MENRYTKKLPAYWIYYLTEERESGMGYHVVDVIMDDGKQFFNCVVENCSILRSTCEIDTNNIRKILVVSKGRMSLDQTETRETLRHDSDCTCDGCKPKEEYTGKLTRLVAQAFDAGNRRIQELENKVSESENFIRQIFGMLNLPPGDMGALENLAIEYQELKKQNETNSSL
jgi:hypothetical protein